MAYLHANKVEQSHILADFIDFCIQTLIAHSWTTCTLDIGHVINCPQLTFVITY